MRTVVSSASKSVVIGPDEPFVIIGERINPTGRKKLAEEMRRFDMTRVRDDARIHKWGVAGEGERPFLADRREAARERRQRTLAWTVVVDDAHRHARVGERGKLLIRRCHEDDLVHPRLHARDDVREQRLAAEIEPRLRATHARRAPADEDDRGQIVMGVRTHGGSRDRLADAPPPWRVRERACYAGHRSAIGGRPLQVVARSRARKRRELRQVRKEAAVPTLFLCRGGA